MQRPDRRQVRNLRHAKPLTGIVAELPVEGNTPAPAKDNIALVACFLQSRTKDASLERNSLLRYVQFAVRSAKFPVPECKEIRRSGLNLFANAKNRPTSTKRASTLGTPFAKMRPSRRRPRSWCHQQRPSPFATNHRLIAVFIVGPRNSGEAALVRR